LKQNVMPHGDTCVSHLFEPGAIPASAGMPPILPTTAELPSGQATLAAAIVEAAAATDAVTGLKIAATAAMTEAAAAASVVNVSLIYGVAIVEGVTATDVAAVSAPVWTVAEAAAALSVQDAVVAAASRSAMLPPVFINLDGTARQANANGVMVNQ
jgi:hypothetical protein